MTEEAQAEVYIAPAVAGVEALYPFLSDVSFRALPIVQQLQRQAETLLTAQASGDPRTLPQISSWWPQAAETKDLATVTFSRDDARLTIAREYGYNNWQAVTDLPGNAPDPIFEAALDALVSGDLDALQRIVAANPQLVHQRSHFGHRSTLLHYLGANGVETHRQKMPLNAVEIARFLVAKGADRGATAEMYGGGMTAFLLAKTSAHPVAAGIAKALCAALDPNAGE